VFKLRRYGKVKRYVILLDNDKAGIEGAIKMAHKLKFSYHAEVSIVVPPHGDPSDYSHDEINVWLSSSISFTSKQEAELLDKISEVKHPFV